MLCDKLSKDKKDFDFNVIVVRFDHKELSGEAQRIVLDTLEKQIALVSLDKAKLRELELELQSLLAYTQLLLTR